MNLNKIKDELNTNDIESLLYWQKEMQKEIDYYDKIDEDIEDELLDLYDFIMDKIAWYYIKLREHEDKYL